MHGMVSIHRLTIALLFSLLLIYPAHSQNDPRQILRDIIAQLQIGKPNPRWYSPELWQIIRVQTQDTGIYYQLVQLGKVKSVRIVQQLTMPAGPLYAMQVEHQNGQSSWQLGISNISKRIEYANFSVGSGLEIPDPTVGTEPIEDSEPTQKPTSDPKPPEPDDSEACKMFPNLC